MEATTPPNTPGFNAKPTCKKRKSLRSRNKGYRKASNPIDAMPSEATAWLYGSMFLMAAAELLAPFIGHTRKSSSTTMG